MTQERANEIMRKAVVSGKEEREKEYEDIEDK